MHINSIDLDLLRFLTSLGFYVLIQISGMNIRYVPKILF